ncbi:predicted protein [Arabidopsis lyrata subsp. lyrata]|uniref:Predicted protein n=1 Tax=Arabidopsis lyrata subsp. lyrata TaxID=81972 RepID=D7MP87_ARALL|nr:predicted protein [Arabidopsis lyrata subsp. lyrata]
MPPSSPKPPTTGKRRHPRRNQTQSAENHLRKQRRPKQPPTKRLQQPPRLSLATRTSTAPIHHHEPRSDTKDSISGEDRQTDERKLERTTTGERSPPRRRKGKPERQTGKPEKEILERGERVSRERERWSFKLNRIIFWFGLVQKYANSVQLGCKEDRKNSS